jgi:hypothetical protein
MVRGTSSEGVIATAGPLAVSSETPSFLTLARALKASTTGPGTNCDRQGPPWWRTDTVHRCQLHTRPIAVSGSRVE